MGDRGLVWILLTRQCWPSVQTDRVHRCSVEQLVLVEAADAPAVEVGPSWMLDGPAVAEERSAAARRKGRWGVCLREMDHRGIEAWLV